MIASVTGRLAAATADRVVIETPGGVGYELTIPLGVMERLPAVGTVVTLATELVVRDDGWALYGFTDDGARRFFQRLTSVSGVGPKLARGQWQELEALAQDRGKLAATDVDDFMALLVA